MAKTFHKYKVKGNTDKPQVLKDPILKFFNGGFLMPAKQGGILAYPNNNNQSGYVAPRMDVGGFNTTTQTTIPQFMGPIVFPNSLTNLVTKAVGYFTGNDNKTAANSTTTSEPAQQKLLYDQMKSLYDHAFDDFYKDHPYMNNVPYSGKKIKLTSGRLTGAEVDTGLLDYIKKIAGANKLDPYKLAALVSRESTFGVGTGADRAGSLQTLVSGWNVDQDYVPYELNRFLGDKKVPGIKSSIDSRGWHFWVDDRSKLNNYLKAHPQLLQQYQKKLASVKPLDRNATYFDLASQWINKPGGIRRYNPGAPNYENLYNQDLQLLHSDPTFSKYFGGKKLGGPVGIYGYRDYDNDMLTNKAYGGDISVADLRTPNWLMKYEPGGPTGISPKDFTLQYINSPKYRERLIKGGYGNIDAEIKRRYNNVKNTNKVITQAGELGIIDQLKHMWNDEPYNTVSGSNASTPGIIFYDPDQAKKINATKDDVLSHEFSHKETRGDIASMAFPHGENFLNDRDIKELTNRLTPAAKKQLHDARADENKADMNAVRYWLYNNGVDVFNKDITPEDLKKVKASGKFTSNRLFKNYKSDDDVLWLLNNVAVNQNPTTNITTAEYGGFNTTTITTLPIIQRATSADSLMIMNNAIAKNKFYKNNPDYPTKTKDKNKIGFTLTDPKVLKKLADVSVQESNIYNNTKDPNYVITYFGQGKSKPITVKDYRSRIGKVPGSNNVYSAADIITKDHIDTYYNPDSPPVLFSPNILPQGQVMYVSNKTGDVTISPYYDPLAVKPYKMRTPQEKIEWEKKYGHKNATPPPANKPKPTPPKPKVEATPPVKQETTTQKTTLQQKPQQTTTGQVIGDSVYGPGNSLIGFMNKGKFTPYSGSNMDALNKTDRDLLQNEEELHKYVGQKFGKEYVKFKTGGWLEKYDEGGEMNDCPPGQVRINGRCVTLPPIYTDDPRKVQAYNDSLALYNASNQERVNNLLRQGFAYDTDKLRKQNYKLTEVDKKEYQRGQVNPKKGLQKIIQSGNDGKVDTDLGGKYDTKAQYELMHGRIAPTEIANIYDTWWRHSPYLYNSGDMIMPGSDFDKDKPGFRKNPNYGRPNAIDKDNYVIRNFFGVPIYDKPLQPYILQQEPKLKKQNVQVQPISSSNEFNPQIKPLDHPDIVVPPVQQGKYRVEYFDPELGQETHRNFMTQAESDEYAKELSKRNLHGTPSAGNITQRVEYRNGGWLEKYNEGSNINFPSELDYKSTRMDDGGGFAVTQTTTINPQEITYTHQPGDNGHEGYMLKRTQTPYDNKRDIKRYTQAPTDPRQVNFISNYAGAIGEPTSKNFTYPTQVPFEGNKHWNIDRFVVDPQYNSFSYTDVQNSKTGVPSTTKEQSRNNTLADMYKYYLLQDPEHRGRAFRQAKRFVRNEIDPRTSGSFYDYWRNNTDPGKPRFDLDTYASENRLKDLYWNEQIGEGQATPDQINKLKDVSMDYFRHYKNMSRRQAKDQWRQWEAEANKAKETGEYKKGGSTELKKFDEGGWLDDYTEFAYGGQLPKALTGTQVNSPCPPGPNGEMMIRVDGKCIPYSSLKTNVFLANNQGDYSTKWTKLAGAATAPGSKLPPVVGPGVTYPAYLKEAYDKTKLTGMKEEKGQMVYQNGKWVKASDALTKDQLLSKHFTKKQQAAVDKYWNEQMADPDVKAFVMNDPVAYQSLRLEAYKAAGVDKYTLKTKACAAGFGYMWDDEKQTCVPITTKHKVSKEGAYRSLNPMYYREALSGIIGKSGSLTGQDASIEQVLPSSRVTFDKTYGKNKIPIYIDVIANTSSTVLPNQQLAHVFNDPTGKLKFRDVVHSDNESIKNLNNVLTQEKQQDYIADQTLQNTLKTIHEKGLKATGTTGEDWLIKPGEFGSVNNPYLKDAVKKWTVNSPGYFNGADWKLHSGNLDKLYNQGSWLSRATNTLSMGSNIAESEGYGKTGYTVPNFFRDVALGTTNDIGTALRLGRGFYNKTIGNPNNAVYDQTGVSIDSPTGIMDENAQFNKSQIGLLGAGNLPNLYFASKDLSKSATNFWNDPSLNKAGNLFLNTVNVPFQSWLSTPIFGGFSQAGVKAAEKEGVNIFSKDYIKAVSRKGLQGAKQTVGEVIGKYEGKTLPQQIKTAVGTPIRAVAQAYWGPATRLTQLPLIPLGKTVAQSPFGFKAGTKIWEDATGTNPFRFMWDPIPHKFYDPSSQENYDITKAAENQQATPTVSSIPTAYQNASDTIYNVKIGDKIYPIDTRTEDGKQIFSILPKFDASNYDLNTRSFNLPIVDDKQKSILQNLLNQFTTPIKNK